MINNYFQLDERQTNIRTEIVAGATTFLTMAYIIFVNPGILAQTGMDKTALVTATCLATAIATLIVGLVARAPIAMAPGMGLNAFFTYTLVMGQGVNWQTALGVVFLSGFVFLVLTLLGLRRRLVEAIPGSLISAIAVGIGLFITFIGLRNLGVVVKNEATLVSAGPITKTVVIGLLGLLVMIFLEMKKAKGALLIGIVFATLLAGLSGEIEKPAQIFSTELNITTLVFSLDIRAALKWSLFGSIFSLMFIDMFDSVGTLVACCHKAKMVDEDGRIKGLDRLLGIDAIATMVGAVLGTSTTTAYIESAAGIEEGGRSGLTSIVTGLLFLAALAFVPLVEVVPLYATAPAPIMVGLFMMREVKNINFSQLDEAFPAFIIMVMIALSYSISTGLAFGFISFVVIKLVSGKAKDVKLTMWIIALLSTAFVIQERIPQFIEYLKSIGG